jgi:hypothetical protein
MNAMDSEARPPTREERLAAKLRENLKRRKQRTRVQQAALPKAEPKS